jgi:iron complex transport system ATP-binding protein
MGVAEIVIPPGPRLGGTVITAEALRKSFGNRLLIDDLNFKLPPGGIVGVIGPNGAGKSSLLRVLAGLDRPARGAVVFEGAALHTLALRERARAIAFLPQPAEAAWPVTVEHLVGLGRLPFGSNDPHNHDAIERALAAAELSDLRSRSITTLSAGEASRAFLARALAGEPRLLLADEPTANLDPAHQLAVMGVLRGLADRGAAILVVQHDLPLAGRFCDRLIVLSQGRLVAQGRPEAVLTPANLAAVFGISARYEGDGRQGFFALPWGLVAEAGRDDIVKP